MKRRNKTIPVKAVAAAGLALALTAGATVEARAQSSLSGHVAVEGRYLPEVTKAERVRTPLAPLDMKFGVEPVEGALTGEPVNFGPFLPTLPPTVWRGDKGSYPRGYLDFALGSWLDGRLKAGYRAIDRRDMALSVRLDALTTLLYRPEDALSGRRRRVDGTVGVDFARLFDAGTFTASAQYSLGRFNYGLSRNYMYVYDNLSPKAQRTLKAPWQTVNEGRVDLGWQSERENPFRWHAGAEVNVFGYNKIPYADKKGTRETTLSLNGGIEGDAGLGSLDGDWSVDGRALLNLYGGDLHPSTNGLVTLTPAWHIFRPKENIRGEGFRWEARIGARLDFSFNQRSGLEGIGDGKMTDERFGLLHIAPDASVGVGNSTFGAYFRATGGVEEQTASRLYALNPYAAPYVTGSLPAYTPADLRVGLTLTPGGGFSATVEGIWRETRSIYAGGLWPFMVNVLAFMPGQPEDALPRSVWYNLHGFSVNAELAWRSWRYLEVEAGGTWQTQRRSTGIFNGYDRPEWTAKAGLKSNPWRELTLEAGWELRAKRSVTVSDGLGYGDCVKLPNVSDLSVGVSYRFTPNFTLGVRASNLLDRKVELLPGFISEGVVTTAGLQILF